MELVDFYSVSNEFGERGCSDNFDINIGIPRHFILRGVGSLCLSPGSSLGNVSGVF